MSMNIIDLANNLDTPRYALAKAIHYVGSQRLLAQACDVSQQTVSHWLKVQIPAKYVIKIEKLTGGKVTRYELRPSE
jgi:DNA-binding transcriptional regulator YdaS (Cro superfamily)